MAQSSSEFGEKYLPQFPAALGEPEHATSLCERGAEAAQSRHARTSSSTTVKSSLRVYHTPSNDDEKPTIPSSIQPTIYRKYGAPLIGFFPNMESEQGTLFFDSEPRDAKVSQLRPLVNYLDHLASTSTPWGYGYSIVLRAV